MEEEYLDDLCPPRCVSYLQARDPSIISWNRHGIHKVRLNLADQFCSESTIFEPTVLADKNSEEKKDEGLSVYLRIKGGVPPNDLYKIQDDILICSVPEGSYTARNRRDKAVVLKKFKFSHIFGPETRQEDLFDAIVKDKILKFINGHNSTLLAYGASGAGKTFTMVGTADKPGIIPRSLDYFFRTVSSNTNYKPTVKPLPNGKIEYLSDSRAAEELCILKTVLNDPQAFSEKKEHVKTYSEMQRRLSSNQVGIVNSFPPIVGVWVSFAEIYNECIYDLLQPLPGRGQQRAKLKIGGLQDDTYVRGLRYVYVRSGLEAYQVLQYGQHNLSYAATAVNQHSSRSHCIFSIRLVAGNDEKHCNVSVFNFCDLAGSERLKKTLNEGDRLKESTKINTSLSVLGRCISNIRDMQQNVKDCCNPPFRESKLTQLFQKALQGKEDIFMFVNINPSPDMFDDTQHALLFSAIAKQIVTQEAPAKVESSRFSSYCQNTVRLTAYLDDDEDERDLELRELRDERAHLTLQISELQDQLEMAIESERTHLTTNFEAIIAIKNKQIKDLENQLKPLRKSYEQLKKDHNKIQIEMYYRKKQEVIVLSSSDDESDSDKENVDNNSRQTTKEMEYLRQIEDLKKDHKKELEHCINKYDNEVKELEGTLKDAKLDYNKLLREYERVVKDAEELTSRNIMLEDQIDLQNAELEGLRSRAVAQREEIEKLEDQIALLNVNKNGPELASQMGIQDEIHDVIEKNVEDDPFIPVPPILKTERISNEADFQTHMQNLETLERDQDSEDNPVPPSPRTEDDE